jgi:RNA polymerase sigma-70 factor (ECF subfamily)
MGQQALTEDEDAETVSAAAGGDLAAFEALVDKYQKKMFNIALRIAGNEADAAEITQDAFVATYRNLAKFRGQARFETWLTAIAINHARNRLKRAKARRRYEAYSLDEPVVTPEGEMAVDPQSSEPSALDRLEQKDRQKAVRDCIGRLEQEFREVLVLRDLQEFSYEEIGDMLKVREGTVKSRLFRAREAVKECLQKVLGEL